MDVGRILAQLAHPSPDVQLEGVVGARKIGAALSPLHPGRAELLRRLGELAAYHERAPERPAPPARVMSPATALALPEEPEACGALALSFTADGKALAVATFAGKVLGWELTQQSQLARIPITERFSLVALAPLIDRIAYRGRAGPVVVADVASGRMLATLDGAAFTALAWAPDARRIATGTPTGDVAVWDAERGKALASWWAHPTPVQALTFDPTGTLVASGGADGRISLWAADTGKRAQRPMEPGDHPQGLAAATRAGSPRALLYTGGGSYLVAGLTGGGLFRWDRESNHRLWTAPGHAAAIRCVRTAHDGLSLVSAGQDGALVLWDALTGECVATLSGHEAPVLSVAVSPDGSRVASVASEPRVLLWDLPPPSRDLPASACRRAVALFARRALEWLAPRP